jgi:hypothetical protein
MNTFIVRLNTNLTDEIKSEIENKGMIITHFDKILPDLVILETKLSKNEFSKLSFVEHANEPRIGSFNDQYMQIR